MHWTVFAVNFVFVVIIFRVRCYDQWCFSN